VVGRNGGEGLTKMLWIEMLDLNEVMESVGLYEEERV
jgi:hypothetical protein